MTTLKAEALVREFHYNGIRIASAKCGACVSVGARCSSRAIARAAA